MGSNIWVGVKKYIIVLEKNCSEFEIKFTISNVIHFINLKKSKLSKQKNVLKYWYELNVGIIYIYLTLQIVCKNKIKTVNNT